MRPIKLTMQAFASYGSKCDIRFDVPNQNLFLVTGDTGAGKTTIFDAIVFALYGEASSSTNRKEGTVLQSQYVPADVEPFVELEFEEDAQRYVVRRVPRHLKLLKRGTAKGTGTREVTGSVSLMMPDGTEYPAKETDRRLIEIVGLSKDQFMQVAMIAQGEFMQLLRAKSDEKKVIFRRLFGTQLYQDIVKEIEERRKALDKQIEQLRTECLSAAANVFIPEGMDEDGRITLLKAQAIGSQSSLSALEDFARGLRQLCLAQEDDWQQQRKKAEEKDKEREEKHAAWIQGTALQKQFEAWQKANEEIERLERMRGEREAQEKLIPQIRASWDLQSSYRQAEEAKRRWEKSVREKSDQEKLLPSLVAEVEAKGLEREKASSALAEKTESCSRAEEKAQKALEILEQIQSAQEKVNSCAQAAIQQENGWKQSQDKVSQREEELEKARAQVKAWEDVPGELEKAIARQESGRQLHSELDALRKLADEGEKQNKKKKAAEKSYAKVSQEWKETRDKHTDILQRYMDDQAGFLAETLREGQPCPVCGSLSHPQPYRHAADREELTRAYVEELAEREEETRKRAEEAIAVSRAQAQLLEEKIAQYKERQIWFVQRAASYLPELTGQTRLQKAEEMLADKQRVVEQQVTERTKQVAQLKKWRTKIEKDEQELPALKEEQEQRRVSLMACREEESAARASLSALQEMTTIPTRKEAEAMLEAAREQKQQAQRAYEDADASYHVAVKQREECQTLLSKAVTELPLLAQEHDVRRTRYEEMMREKDLGTEQWQSLCRSYPLDKADEFTQNIGQFRSEMAAANASAQAALEQIAGREKPDLPVLQAQWDKARVQWDEANQMRELAAGHLRDNQKSLAILQAKLHENREIAHTHARLCELYKRLSGNVKDGRMDLETFVQRYYLEQILYAANRRFLDMSAGQFELRMVDAVQAGQGRNRGLDLIVYSYVTGKEREIRTLSGGESFMAALSLALGMSDQIQRQSAAIHPDVMFIDEGFGSLDDHARDQAVRVLRNMAGGNRLIGIISHVTELKTQIEDKLIVIKDEQGSHAHWELS